MDAGIGVESAKEIAAAHAGLSKEEAFFTKAELEHGRSEYEIEFYHDRIEYEYTIDAANITALSEYDQNYTLLARTLQKWADALLEAGHDDEAVVLMDFAVSTHTDISRTYCHLADYWAARGRGDKIEEMMRIAEGLRSANKGAILRHLKQSLDGIVGVLW